MNKKGERATKQLRISPSVYERLRVLAFKRRKSLGAVIGELVASV